MPSKNTRGAKKVVAAAAAKVVAAAAPKAPVVVKTAAETLQELCGPGTDYWRMQTGLVSWADAMDADEAEHKARSPAYAAKCAAAEAAWMENYRAYHANAAARAAEAAEAAAREHAAVAKAAADLRDAPYGTVHAFAEAQVEDSRLWRVAKAELQQRHWAFEDEERARHVCSCPNPDGGDAEWDPPMGWECECFKALHRDALGNVEECRFFNSPMGCREGDACPYSHVKRDISEIACRFETSGVGCKPARGKVCPYKHAAPPAADWRAPAPSWRDDARSVASAGSGDGWVVAGPRGHAHGPACGSSCRPPMHGRAAGGWRK